MLTRVRCDAGRVPLSEYTSTPFAVCSWRARCACRSPSHIDSLHAERREGVSYSVDSRVTLSPSSEAAAMMCGHAGATPAIAWRHVPTRRRTRPMPKRNDIHKVMIIGSGPDRHRPGLRVRLLRHPGLQGPARAGLRDRAGQLQPGHDHDRPGHGRRHLHRAAERSRRMTEIIEKERPDALLPNLGGQTGLNLSSELAQGGRAGQVRRQGHRRAGRRHRAGRGPASPSRRR